MVGSVGAWPVRSQRVPADVPALRVRLTDPRQVVWSDSFPDAGPLPERAPEGYELLQVEVPESLAEQLRRRAAERGVPMADLLRWVVRLLHVEAIGAKRTSGG